MLGIEVDISYDVVRPCPHSVIQDGVGLSIPLYRLTEFDDRTYFWLSRFATKP